MSLNLRDIHWGELFLFFNVGFQRFETFFGEKSLRFFFHPLNMEAVEYLKGLLPNF